MTRITFVGALIVVAFVLIGLAVIQSLAKTSEDNGKDSSQ